MSASFVWSAQKYFGYSSVYRFQYQSAAPFVPTGGLASFFAIPAGNAGPVIEALGRVYEGAINAALGLEGRLQERPELVGNRPRLPSLVVIRHEDTLRPREDPPALLLLDLVAQRERGVPDFRGPDRHLNLVTPRRLGFEVNLDVGQDEVDLVERPLVRPVHVKVGPRELDVGKVHPIVDVAHPVDVAEAHLDVRREARHPSDDAERRRKTFRWSLFLADEPREFVGEIERDLPRRIALNRGTRGQRGFRELAINRPRQLDPAPKGLVDRSDGSGRHSRQHGVRREFGVLSHHGPAGYDRSGTDHSAAVDRRVHADETVVSDGATMDDRCMTDGHASANHGGQTPADGHDHIVPDVRGARHDDRVEVASEDGARPDTRRVLHRHVADEDRARGAVDHRVTRDLRARS